METARSDGDAAQLVRLAFGWAHGEAHSGFWPFGRPQGGATYARRRPRSIGEVGSHRRRRAASRAPVYGLQAGFDARGLISIFSLVFRRLHCREPVATSMVQLPTQLAALNERARAIFRVIVESYLATGEPVGSRNLSRLLPTSLSPASVRNVMSDLEHLGLIYAPHTSAGRLPTQTGLRLFLSTACSRLAIWPRTSAARSKHRRRGAGRSRSTRCWPRRAR